MFEQYDGTVRANSVMPPGSDAGVLRVAGTDFAIAMTVDCNARHVLLDPYEGGKGAVAEAARNIACSGARPLGITDCLNFGNPEKPDIYFQFVEACRGIGEACRAFGTPVTGGNVSLYNQNPTGAIDPTPTVGMVGLLADVNKTVPSHFQYDGDAILLLGDTRGHLGGSAYWAEVLDTVGGAPPPVDLSAERHLQDLLVEAADNCFLTSAHDLSDGGLAVALAECCIGGPWDVVTMGAQIDLTSMPATVSDEGALFGEDGARVLISPAYEAAVLGLAKAHGVPCRRIGVVNENAGEMVVGRNEQKWQWPVHRLRAIHLDAIPRRMAAVTTADGGS